MLMKVESEELRNCRRLLDYIDGKFQKRLNQGKVDFSFFTGSCGTKGCLLGWFVFDVLGVKESWSLQGWCLKNRTSYFGMSGWVSLAVFGSHGGDIHARRAALVAHIERLEAKEKVAA